MNIVPSHECLVPENNSGFLEACLREILMSRAFVCSQVTVHDRMIAILINSMFLKCFDMRILQFEMDLFDSF